MSENKMTYVYFCPRTNQMELWTRNHGFDFLGLERFEVDTLQGEFWVDGCPESHCKIWIGEI